MQRVFDKLETRQRAGGNRLVGVDDKSIGEPGHGLKLRIGFFGAEFDRRKLRVVGVAGEIVELVTQHIGAARQLILCHQRALALDLQNIGKNLGEDPKFPGEAGDLFETGRICGAPHRLVDGVFQVCLGRQRRLGIVLFAGHHIVSRQRPVRDQLAIDIARQIGFRHAVSVGRHTGGNTFKSEIGDAHAGDRDRKHDSKAEHDFAAKSQCGEPHGYRSRPCAL